MKPEQIRERIALILGFEHVVPTPEETAEGAVEVWRYQCPEGARPLYGVLSVDAYELPHFEADPRELGWLTTWLTHHTRLWSLSHGLYSDTEVDVSFWSMETGEIEVAEWADTPNMGLCLAIIACVEAAEKKTGERIGTPVAPGWLRPIPRPEMKAAD